MGRLDSPAIHDMAKSLEVFFTGLTELGLMAAYSIQLQIPQDNSYDEHKLKVLLNNFSSYLKEVTLILDSSNDTDCQIYDTESEVDCQDDVVDVDLTEDMEKGAEEKATCRVPDSSMVISQKCKGDDSAVEEGTLWEGVLTSSDVLPVIYSDREHGEATVEVEETLGYEVTDEDIKEKMLEVSELPLHRLGLVNLGEDPSTKEAIVIDLHGQHHGQESSSRELASLLSETPNASREGVRSKRYAARKNHPQGPACKHCSKVCRTQAEMEKHIESRHSNTLHCDLCHEVLPTITSLRKHCEIQHGVVGCFGCNQCGKRMNTRSSYMRHMDVHEANKGAVCDICGKAFTRSDYMSRHRRVHNGEKPYTCTVCKKRFNNKSNLNTHMLIHSEVKFYECDACGKRFARTDKLKEHVLRHLKVKRYRCEVCFKEYAEHRDLKKHQAHHKTKMSK